MRRASDDRGESSPTRIRARPFRMRAERLQLAKERRVREVVLDDDYEVVSRLLGGQ